MWERAETDGVAMDAEDGEEADETCGRVDTDGLAEDAHPKPRNRAGRRVAGRRAAPRGSTRGRGGSKYLKRCPARNERAQRKRGRGRGRRLEPPCRAGFVRGGGGRSRRAPESRNRDEGPSGVNQLVKTPAYWEGLVGGYIDSR